MYEELSRFCAGLWAQHWGGGIMLLARTVKGLCVFDMSQKAARGTGRRQRFAAWHTQGGCEQWGPPRGLCVVAAVKP